MKVLPRFLSKRRYTRGVIGKKRKKKDVFSNSGVDGNIIYSGSDNGERYNTIREYE